MRGVFLEHPASLGHDTGAHPEQAARIVAIEQELAERDWLGYETVQSPRVDRAVLHAVHPEAYVDGIEAVSARGGGALDLDTVASAGSFDAAMRAAGGAVRMVELLLSGEADAGFSAHRPPGHHALPARSMGFCLFNNVSVAARFALDHGGLERVMIVDWDVHHGNGTNDIFHGSDQVLFVSIHESPLYPGTGPAEDAGSGAGEGFTVNLPVPPGSGDETFVALIGRVAAPLVRAFVPQLVLISAGYDAHREDPLADCEVTDDGYALMTRSLRAAADSVGARVGAVLEGGYAPRALARSVAVTMEELVAPQATASTSRGLASTSGPEHELVLAAHDRLRRWWPGVGA